MFAFTGVETKKASVVTECTGRNNSSDAVHFYYGLLCSFEIVLVHGCFGELPMGRVIQP